MAELTGQREQIDILLININRWNKVGIFALGAYVRQKGLKVKLIDGSKDSVLAQFKKINETNDILAVGFTATTDIIEAASDLAKEFKRINPKIFMILGGYHGTILPEETLKSATFDMVVVREGEITLTEIILKLKEGVFPTQVVGCYEKKGAEIIFNGFRGVIEDLDSLPYPAYDLVDLKKYFHAIRQDSRLKRVVLLLISRGCPFDCVFCGSKQMWQRRFRIQSVDYVMGLIKWLREKYQINGISFLDDELVTNRKYINEFCDRFVKERLNQKIKWSCHSRVSSIDLEILKKMKAAGCALIRFGLESGSPGILSYLKKNSIKVEQSLTAVKLCQAVGLPSFGSFIIGSPNETIEDIVQTIEFIQNSGLTYAEVFSLIPYPGTEVYQFAQVNNLLKPGIKWSDFIIEGENQSSILRSFNFDFQQIDQIKSYIELNVVYPLNHKLSVKKLNHREELTKILNGDLAKTEFSVAGKKQFARQKLLAKFFKAIREPNLILPFLANQLCLFKKRK